MKFTCFSVAGLAAALLTGSTHAGFPDENEGSLSRKLDQSGGRGNGNADKAKTKDDTVKLIVRYKNEDGHKLADRLDTRRKGRDISRKQHTEAITATRSDMDLLKADPNIDFVEEDFEVFALPHMRGYDVGAAAGQGGHRSLQGEEVPYGITMVNPGNLAQSADNNVKVCVVDTGYGNGHEDLPNLPEDAGFSPYDGQVWDNDGHGHGTHCAGTIGAIGNNNKGVTSVNPDSDKFSFYIGKGLTDSGSGSNSGVLAAVQACVDAEAKIISMSLGGGGFSQAAEDQYKQHYDTDGVLIIAAAGNGGNSAYSYPASYKYIMSVAAVDENENRASFSQYNDQVEIAGPGVSVKSTLPNNQYASWSGTSMATPHVAGVAALVWSHFPDCSNKQIREALIVGAATRLGGCNDEYGFGIVDAQGAFDYLSQHGCTFPVGEAEGGCNQCADCTSAPTSSPTAFPGCPEGEIEFKLSLQTDNYGSETSWTVTDGANFNLSGNGYGDSQIYEEKHCVPSNACTFTISDSFGDGICCGYGQGSYKVFMDGVEKGSGGQFASSESVDLCPLQTVVGETGRKYLSNTIENNIVEDITFRNQYLSPVVVAFINTRNGGQSVSARIRNVSPSGFQLFMQEPDNQSHTGEWVSYIVVESGRHTLEGGIIVEAGVASTTIVHEGGQSFTGHEKQFNEAFSDTPAILHSLMTHTNNDFMASLVTAVTTDSFKVAMEAAETNKKSSGEDVGWIAFSSATGLTGSASFTIGTANDGTNDGVTNSPHVINLSAANFDEKPDIVVSLYGARGKDGSWARGAGVWSKDAQHAYAEEDQVSNDERKHIDEQFAWAAFTPNTDLKATA